MTGAERHFPLFSYASFNVNALCDLATRTRNGLVCSCDLYQRPASGSFNWAISILFEDGVEWILRSPRRDTTLTARELSAKLLASEAATLKYLRLRTNIPVPELYSYSSMSNNGIGIPYILMSKAKGRPLEEAWGLSRSAHDLHPGNKAKVLFQLGHITWKLAQLRFDQIGSLFEMNGAFTLGECLSRGHNLHERHSLDDIYRGPFATESDFYKSLIAAFAQHAKILPLGHHCFVAPIPSREDYMSDAEYYAACDLWNDFVTVGAKIDSAANRLDYILISDALQDLIHRHSSASPEVTLSEPFPLCHPDLSASNIFVDDDFNITSIIDWAFCSSVPLPALLSPPGLPQSRYALGKDLIDAFKDGYKDASSRDYPDRVQSFLTSGAIRILDDSHFSWSLIRLLTLDSTNDLKLFHTLWESVHGSEPNVETFIASQRSLPRYVRLYEEVRLEDKPTIEILKAEKDYFKANTLDLSLAQKLTVSSNWGFQYSTRSQSFRRVKIFVASAELWRWLSKVREEQELASRTS